MLISGQERGLWHGQTKLGEPCGWPALEAGRVGSSAGTDVCLLPQDHQSPLASHPLNVASSASPRQIHAMLEFLQ